MPSGELPGKRVYTVAGLTAALKGVIEGGFSRVWVEGELSGWKVYGSGHAYFTLKDAEAQLSGVMWRGSRTRLRFEPKDGDRALVQGKLTVYEQRGNYQIVVDSMEPTGLGALQAALEQLKAKLEKEGLFDPARKRKLPPIAWNVGIVTSPTGAVIRDMIRTLKRRFPGVRIVLAPVAVQGEGAAPQIAQAIADLNRLGGLDVLIVGRGEGGGGSLEDLWAFNEEIVARAISASAIPVVSAVGHETDFTIADFVADVRASTPTAAAEIVAPERAGIEEYLAETVRRMAVGVRERIDRHAQRTDEMEERLRRGIAATLIARRRQLDGLTRHLAAVSPAVRLKHDERRMTVSAQRLIRAMTALLERRSAKVGELSRRLAPLTPGRRFADATASLARTTVRLDASMRRIAETRGARLAVVAGKLSALSPLGALARGYALVTDADGQVVKSVAAVKTGSAVSIRLADGTVDAVVGPPAPRQERLF
ncbi:MAG: exodeoxyribonuclease VII large subunit [Nitrospinae bacterium]|nr:exodeoxyribonuclease VII large subunit [Nitrospinota bacterium]